MNSASSERGVTPLDRAHAMRMAGDSEGAQRLAGSILTAFPEDLGAAALCAWLLFEAGRPEAAAPVARRLVDAFIARGDLPSARVAAFLVAHAGGDADAAVAAIAKAFGAGSVRVSDSAAIQPPALPRQVVVAPFFAKVEGDALTAALAKACERFLAVEIALDGPVPRLPLFGALSPTSLTRLLSALELRDIAAGEYALREGEPGHEALIVVRGVLNAVRKDGNEHQLLAVLGPGALFGEMALVSAAPRAASVVAVEPSRLLAIERGVLDELARQDATIARELGAFCHRRMLGNLLRHSAILSSVDPAERKALIARFRTETFERGDTLVRQDEEAHNLYLIASGEVQVRSTDAEGEAVVLAQLGPGEVVGEISLVLRRPATATVVALSPTIALTLSREGFHEVIREHPALLRELYETATQREEETRSLVALKAEDVSDVILL